jgi:hypothetical protein
VDKGIARAADRYHDPEAVILSYSEVKSEVWLNELAEAEA